MSLTKEQQAALLEELKGWMPRAKLEFDGAVLDVGRVRVSENKTPLAVAINNKIDYAWGIPDHEDYMPVTKKIWRRVTKSKYRQSEIKKLIKEVGIRKVKKELPDYNEKLVRYDPSFNTALTLVRQFSKIEGLKLVELGGKPL